MKRFLLLFTLIFSPVLARAEGSGFNTDFRVIEFNDPRLVCVEAGAPLHKTPDAPAIGTLGERGERMAIGISLDQDWIVVQIGSEPYLIRPEYLAFGAC